MISRRIIIGMILFMLLSQVYGNKLQYRLVYNRYQLEKEEDVKKLCEIMKRAKAVGYNGLVLGDYRWPYIPLTDKLIQNITAIKNMAKELGLDIYGVVCPFGYSWGVVSQDPNLAEGLPVYDAFFVVKGKEADIVSDPQVSLKNGDFEKSLENEMSGWEFQDYTEISTFADREIRHSGNQSLRMERISRYGCVRIGQKVMVSPFRQYHLSVWIKTVDFDALENLYCIVSTPEGHKLCFLERNIKGTQDWKEYHIIFNSFSNKEINICLQVCNGRHGKIWWDDVKLEEVGLLNVLRRDGCPLIVKGEDGTIYEEGRDFEKIFDEEMSKEPYASEYTVYHKTSVMRITPNSRIRDGQRLRVSFYHNIIVNYGQIGCCLSEPKVYKIVEEGIERVNKFLQPNGFFMNHDEIRVANWCETCRRQNLTPGKILTDNVSRCVKMINKVSPQSQIFVWSDMFDPFHNARDNYYFVNGSWEGSWEGLPKEVIIVNWHYGMRHKNMQWFADRGHSQIITGYYDSRSWEKQILHMDRR